MKVKHIVYIFMGIATAWQLLPGQSSAPAKPGPFEFVSASAAKQASWHDRHLAAKARGYIEMAQRRHERPVFAVASSHNTSERQRETDAMMRQITAEIRAKCDAHYAAVGGCQAQMKIAAARDKALEQQRIARARVTKQDRLIAAARAAQKRQASAGGWTFTFTTN